MVLKGEEEERDAEGLDLLVVVVLVLFAGKLNWG